MRSKETKSTSNMVAKEGDEVLQLPTLASFVSGASEQHHLASMEAKVVRENRENKATAAWWKQFRKQISGWLPEAHWSHRTTNHQAIEVKKRYELEENMHSALFRPHEVLPRCPQSGIKTFSFNAVWP